MTRAIVRNFLFANDCVLAAHSEEKPRKGSKLFEKDRLQKLDAKRLARKNRLPDPAVPC